MEHMVTKLEIRGIEKLELVEESPSDKIDMQLACRSRNNAI